LSASGLSPNHSPTTCDWELALDPQNIKAGEEIRYLPCHHANDIDWPAGDCWLFDDDRLVLSLFKPDGRSGGFASEGDPYEVARYQAVRDALWPRAMPSAEYPASSPGPCAPCARATVSADSAAMSGAQLRAHSL
jgi:hypothetical protein